MAKKRIIYQTEALYVGTTGQASPDQLYRIQSASHDVDIQYVDINEMGRLSRLTTEIIEAPVVSLDFSYYILDGKNEKTFGFSVPDKFEPEASIISGFASNIEAEEKNYYLLTVPEGKDASDGSSSYGIGNGLIGIGNGYITSYQAEASVGEIPTATVSVEATNIRFDTDSNSVPNPGINTENGEPISHDITIPVSTTGDLSAAALRPGDVVMSFGGENLEYGGAILPGMDSADSPQTGSACIQSFSLDVPLSRTPMLCLTNFYPITRNIDFPIRSTLSVNANISSISSGSLNDLICNPEKPRDITITMYNKCREDTSIIYKFKNATLDSQGMSSALDTDKTVDLTFSTEVDYSQPNVCINGTIVDSPTTTSTPTTTTTAPTTTTSTSTTTASPTSPFMCASAYCVESFKTIGGADVSNATGKYEEYLDGETISWRVEVVPGTIPKYSYIKRNGDDYQFEIYNGIGHDIWSGASPTGMECPNKLSEANGGESLTDRVYKKGTLNSQSVTIFSNRCPYVAGCPEPDAFPYSNEYTVFWEDDSEGTNGQEIIRRSSDTGAYTCWGWTGEDPANALFLFPSFDNPPVLQDRVSLVLRDNSSSDALTNYSYSKGETFSGNFTDDLNTTAIVSGSS